MSQTTKLTIRSGDAEAVLEGSLDELRGELDRILDRILPPAEAGSVTISFTAAPAEPAASPPPPAPDASWKERLALGRHEVLEALAGASLAPAAVEPLFHVDGAGALALRRLPATGRERHGDTLLLLLYGALVILGEASQGGHQLMTAARRSGSKVQRVYDALVRRPALFVADGKLRGKRYRLSPAGIEHCERLIQALLSQLET